MFSPRTTYVWRATHGRASEAHRRVRESRSRTAIALRRCEHLLRVRVYGRRHMHLACAGAPPEFDACTSFTIIARGAINSSVFDYLFGCYFAHPSNSISLFGGSVLRIPPTSEGVSTRYLRITERSGSTLREREREREREKRDDEVARCNAGKCGCC